MNKSSRNRRIVLRANESEYERIKWAAETHGISLSEYMRTCALEKADRELLTVYPRQREDDLSDLPDSAPRLEQAMRQPRRFIRG